VQPHRYLGQPAAVSVCATFDQTTLDEFEQIMNVTFMGQYGAKRLCLI
jgi:hypothetical protein